MWTKSQAREFINKFLSEVDILLVGDEEISILIDEEDTNEAIKKFHDLGIDKVVVKRGAKGAIGSDGSNIYDVAAIKPKALIDTVGAGDGFAAGFLSAYLKGDSFEESIEFANAVGSLVVGIEGDNEGLPYYEDVLAHLGKIKTIER